MSLFTTVYGKSGRAVGRYYTISEPLQEDVRFIRNFLCQISKQQSEEMEMSTEKKTDVTNMVWIAGTIRTLKTRDDGSAFVLIDVGEKSKYIPCNVYEDKELASALGRFREDDFIQLQGFVRAWSQKKDGKWENHVDVRITHIKNKPPQRESPKKSQPIDDDDIPF